MKTKLQRLHEIAKEEFHDALDMYGIDGYLCDGVYAPDPEDYWYHFSSVCKAVREEFGGDVDAYLKRYD